MMLDPVEWLRQLIQIPSVNPMGRDAADSPFGESRLTDFLQHQCESLGWPWLRQRVHPGRDNLFALLRGNPPVDAGGEFLLWDVHQDTVPVDGMTVEPFGGAIRDARIYGRGASDVKGPMAAMLAALSQRTISHESSCDCPTIVIVFTINEECGFTGVRAACDLLRQVETARGSIVGGTITPRQLFPRLPDAAIAAEPTDFRVVVAHQGVIRWRCHTIGRAAHTSRPDAGINAIYGMAEVIRAIEQHHRQLQTNGPIHRLCGRPTTCVSRIHGGVGVNTVPDRATIEIDRRLRPDESPAEAHHEFVRFVADHADIGQCRLEHDPPFMQSTGLCDELNGPIAIRVAEIAQQFGQPSEPVGVPYATDAAPIAALGIPTVVFGPGSIDQAHTADEFIEIEKLRRGTEIFASLAYHGLNRVR